MKRIEDLNITGEMAAARAIIEKRGYALVGWDEFDYEETLSQCRERRFQDAGLCIYTYEASDGLIYKPYATLYYRGGKKQACMIFRRVEK